MIGIPQLWEFVKNPEYSEDENRDFGYRLRLFRRLLLYALLISVAFSILVGLLEQAGFIALGEHAIEALFKNHSLPTIALLAVVVAPVVEELLFRAPLVLFKNSRFFKPLFYLFTLVFGFYHITNFEITNTILLFSPLLVAPQISIGFFLGYIRIRFGLLWAIALHASYNLLLLTPVLLAKSLNLPLE
jgi:membrane protease YdiL (CAAX protease family)